MFLSSDYTLAPSIRFTEIGGNVRKTFGFAAIVAAISLTTPAVAAPWSFDSSKAWELGQSYVHIQESYDVGQPSRVRVSTVASKDANSISKICLTFPSEGCPLSLLGESYAVPEDQRTYPHKNIYFELVMPACDVATDKDWCIEDVRVSQSSSNPLSAQFVEAVGAEKTPSFPEWGIPEGGHISLWRAGPDSGFEGLEVAAIVQVNFVYYPFSGPKYVVQDFNVQLIPFSRDSSVPYSAIDPVQSPEDPAGVGSFTSLAAGCVWQRQGECGKRIDSPKDVWYGITLRSSAGIGEFLNGRLEDPKLDVKQADGVSVLSLDAKPVLVGEFGILYDKTPQLEKEMPFLTGAQITKPYFPDAQKMIEGFRKLAGDKASGENTTWRLSTTSVNGLNSCYLNKGVAGLVTTNATTYGGEPPELKDGFLNYTVAGMHYLSNGTDLFIGTYDLIIRSDVARCLYGYSKAPVSATVTVVGEGGQENIATTVVSEKDGWLKLAAYGFTFSEKEIKVKITQPQTKTLTNYIGSATSLTSKQRAEIRATVEKGKGNSKFICTGIRLEGQPQALNTLVRKRAKLACDYAKSLNTKLSTFYQTKTTKARSYNGKVLVVIK